MRKFIITISLVFTIFLNAQISPILDYTWTIEQIDTGSQIIMADLNPFGQYDTFEPIFVGNFDDLNFYYLLFGHCEGDITFLNSTPQFYYHFSGCLLSSDDSSQIALYFNNNYIQQNTNQTTIDNDISPNVYGPLDYSFTAIGDIIYMDITNSIGEVARFSASTLSNKEFSEKDISIFPNPVNDKLFIQSPTLEVDGIKIYDMNGRLVKMLSFRNDGNYFEMSWLQKGVYILSIDTAFDVLHQKLIKN